jgi:hypothetical protein
MKRITKLMCLVAMMVLAVTSCKKAETKQGFTATLQEMQVEDTDLDSKVYLEGTTPVFLPGDQVMMFNVDYSNPDQSQYALYQTVDGGTNAVFTPVGDGITDSKKGAFFAYYPGERCFPELTQGNRAYFMLDAVQTYRKIGGNAVIPERALFGASRDNEVANLGDVNFMFYQVGGVAQFNLYNDATGFSKKVKSITVEDKYFSLTGMVSFKVDKINPVVLTGLLENYNKDNEATMKDVHDYMSLIGYDVYFEGDAHGGEYGGFDPQMTVTLNCPNVAIGTSKATATPFYIGLRPLALTYGFYLTVTYDDDTSVTIEVNKDCKVKPGVIKKFNANLNR